MMARLITLMSFWCALYLFMANAALASKVYYPHVAAAGGWNTELCAINAKDTPSTVQFLGYDSNGVLIQSISRDINANGRVELDVGASFSNPGSISYVIADSSDASIVGYTKFFIGGTYRASVVAKSSADDSVIYIPHVASNAQWWTGVGILNTTSETISPTLRFDNGVTRNLTLAPNQKTAFTIEGIVGVGHDALQTAVIENASGAIAFELFGTTGVTGDYYLSGISLDDSLVTTLYYPHITTVQNSGGNWWTGLVAYNPGASAATLHIYCYSEGGGLLRTIIAEVPANSKYVGTAESLGLHQSTAWVKVLSDKPVSGFELFGTNDGEMLGGYECNALSLRSGVLPKLESTGWTGTAFVNPGEEPCTLTLNAMDNDGNVIATASYDLAARSKIVRIAQDFFSASIAGAKYVRFEATSDVVTFQLNGSSDGTMLDALPAIAVSSGLDVETGAKEAIELFGSVMDMAPLVEEITGLFGQILSDDPDVPLTVTPPLDTIDSDNPPSTITAVLDYGAGFVTPENATMSGSVTVEITNLVATNSSFSLDMHIVANNLQRNGVLVLDGAGTFAVNLQVNSNVLGIELDADMDNLNTSTGSFDGAMHLAIPSLSIEEGTFSPITVTFEGLTAAGHSISSGTIIMSPSGSDSYLLDIDIETDLGAADGDVLLTNNPDDSYTVSTQDTMSFGAYQVDINSVLIDSAVCTEYPLSGNIVISDGGETHTLTFTGSCDGYDFE